jgi:hypothetical protein
MSKRSQSYIRSFEKYILKVFGLRHFLAFLEDNRKAPDIGIQNIFMAYFWGSVLRMKATSTIEEETRNGVLRKRVVDISDDTIGYGLDHLDVESIQKMWYMLAMRAKRNGMLRNSPFHDYIVGVFDGIETYSSYSAHRNCDRCLSRVVETNRGKKIQYYHRVVVLTLVGYDSPIPIGLEMMKKGEDEVYCALRLLKRVVKNLGVRFLDIVMCDALYCTPNFFSECRKLNVHAGAVLKENQENLLESARSQKKKTEPVLQSKTNKEKLKLWDFGEVFWDTADQDVRVIWADREVLEKERPGKKGKKKKKKKKKGKMRAKGKKIKKIEAKEGKNKNQSLHPQWNWENKKRVFVFSKKMDHLPSQVLYRIGQHRWDIDAIIFMDMVKHWHLKHKTLHFENAYENMLSIRLIAYFIFMFFFYRHINSRRKNKIKSYTQMAIMIYRSACTNLEPELILIE